MFLLSGLLAAAVTTHGAVAPQPKPRGSAPAALSRPRPLGVKGTADGFIIVDRPIAEAPDAGQPRPIKVGDFVMLDALLGAPTAAPRQSMRP